MYHIHHSFLEYAILPFFIITYYEYPLLFNFFLIEHLLVQENSYFNTITYTHYINLLGNAS